MTQKYLDGQIELGQLEEWLVPLAPLYASDPTTDDADFVATIELGLAEISDGIIAEGEFRKSLWSAIANRLFAVDWLPSDVLPRSGHITSGSTNQNVSTPELDFAGTTAMVSRITSLSVITLAATEVAWTRQPSDTVP